MCLSSVPHLQDEGSAYGLAVGWPRSPWPLTYKVRVRLAFPTLDGIFQMPGPQMDGHRHGVWAGTWLE